MSHKKHRPAKSSDKADLLLLGIFFKPSAFPIYFEILPLFPNLTGPSKSNILTLEVWLFSSSFVISVQFGDHRN